MFSLFRRKETPQYDVWHGFVSRFRGRLQSLANEMSVTLGKEVMCFYSPSKGGVLSIEGSHVAEISVLGEMGFPVTAFISTNLEGELLQKLEQVFAGHVNTVLDLLRK